jgi:fumarate hydratase subunit alpha
VIEKAPYCCPPVFVAVSVGGTPSTALEEAEEVLLQNLTKKSSPVEGEILNRINRSGIGPGGWGGKNTALCVRIKEVPCHIATFPVGIVISCWCLRKGVYNG